MRAMISDAMSIEGNDLQLLIKTADFAAKKHSFQRRKDPQKSPYINHPIGVANILAQEAGVTDISVLQISTHCSHTVISVYRSDLLNLYDDFFLIAAKQ